MYNTRKFFIVIFTICIGLLIFGLYLEHVHGLEACPLCMFQRIAYTVIIFIALIGATHNPKNLLLQIIYKLLIVFLYAAIFEFLYRPQTSINIIINEYLNSSKFFLQETQKKYLNAILDKISKKIRN